MRDRYRSLIKRNKVSKTQAAKNGKQSTIFSGDSDTITTRLESDLQTDDLLSQGITLRQPLKAKDMNAGAEVNINQDRAKVNTLENKLYDKMDLVNNYQKNLKSNKFYKAIDTKKKKKFDKENEVPDFA